jgi:hypothetical protein
MEYDFAEFRAISTHLTKLRCGIVLCTFTKERYKFFSYFLLPQLVLEQGLQEAEAFANDVFLVNQRKLEDRE